jgi:hypothetical protein
MVNEGNHVGSWGDTKMPNPPIGLIKHLAYRELEAVPALLRTHHR